MKLADVQRQADSLSLEDRNGLLAYLIERIPDFPPAANEEELECRDAEMDSGEVTPISHQDFLARVGRNR
jgi:hypothetical protein